MFPRKIHTHECLGMQVSHKHTYSLLSRYVCVPQTYIPRTWRYVRGLRNIHTHEIEICMVRRNIPTHNIPVCMFPTQIQTVSCLMYIRSQKHTHRGGMSSKQRLPSSMYFPCNSHALDLEGSTRRKRDMWHSRDARIHERGLSHTMKHAPLRDLPPPKAGMYVRMYVCMYACTRVCL